MKWLPALTLALALTPGAAHAQFANYSLGFEAGYASQDNVGVDPHVAFGPLTTIYVDSGFEATIRFAMGFAKETKVAHSDFYLAPAFGVRYNFLSDVVRPQLAAEIAFYHYFGSQSLKTDNIFAVGLGPSLELFLKRDLSLSLVGMYHRLLIVDADDGNAFVGFLRATAYF